VLVASPEPMAMREALYFHQRLVASTMPFTGFVINKVHVQRRVAAALGDVERALAATPAVAALGLSGTSLRMAAESLLAAHADLEVLADADADAIARLRSAGGGHALLVQVPFMREDIHDVQRLIALGQYLVS
jgi:hypothetical protein